VLLVVVVHCDRVAGIVLEACFSAKIDNLPAAARPRLAVAFTERSECVDRG
jgi:hypothetical protein